MARPVRVPLRKSCSATTAIMEIARFATSWVEMTAPRIEIGSSPNIGGKGWASAE